jgi:hypothetical protein
MPFARLALLSSLSFAAALLPAHANVLIKVDQATQHMTVSVDGEPRFSWPVATGKSGYDTPSGSFRPNRMEAEHFSDEYDAAPMPHSIFFDEHGHAIHGSSEKLGRPASHGCVRLSPAHAAELFALVQREGMGKTRVEIEGTRASTEASTAARVPSNSARRAARATDPNEAADNTAPVTYRAQRGYADPSAAAPYGRATYDSVPSAGAPFWWR